MMKVHWILLLICPVLLASCSDAEVVAGTFHGKIYAVDTVDADIKVTKINDGIIRLDLTGPMINGGYVEYAQLRKNAEDAYTLEWSSDQTGAAVLELSGYYYDGYLVVDSWTHQYKFSGGKE